ncbi:PilW family protein [Candidatus Halobeggiatoa sp. HSG11]|nr:PilW family protein [Candidatus Halobeggiatoa sp. HSG11]
MKKLHGFSLVEIMVALAISTILLAGVVSIFNMSKRTYTLQSGLSDLQSNARFVMNELIDELRVIGYEGCLDSADIENLDKPFLDNTADLGINVSINDDDIPGTDSDTYPPSDRLVFKIDKSVQQELILTPDDEAQFLVIANTISLTASSNALIDNLGVNWGVGMRDCANTDYYNATQVDNIITLDRTPEMVYQTPIDIFMDGGVPNINKSTVMYEVRADDNGEFGLYKTIGHGDSGDPITQELFVEGVQNMQIRYGIDTSGNGIPNIYNNIPPAQGTNNADVASVRLTILMRTAKKRGVKCPFNKKFFLDVDLDCNICEDGSYQPLEDNKEYEEGYCHRLFTTTVGVRNGVFPYTP